MAPRWAANAGDDNTGSRRPDGRTLEAADVLAALSEKGPANVLSEAFERVVDIGGGFQDETLILGSTGDANRRVFESVVWVYDHVRDQLGGQKESIRSILQNTEQQGQ